MDMLHVELGERSYPIYIGAELLSDAVLLQKHVKASQVCIVTSEVLASIYLDTIKQAFDQCHLSIVIMPDGEPYKTLEQLTKIFDQLLTDKHNRTTTLIALGGGIVGDMTGFAAACYQRGVQFIQIPTTLLAQVDSSVGGKTGVNHPLGKNMIGAFHQPAAVIIDINVLNTLPDNQLSAGLAEVIKYGLIKDNAFFQWLEQNMSLLIARDINALNHAIKTSCATKAGIVMQDEKEEGQRALLNLGHTFGHAIETATNYTLWLHGEAVAVGMLMAADLSCRLGYISSNDVEQIKQLLQAANLPVELPAGITAGQLVELMQVDKKVIDGQLRLVLLHAVGDAIITSKFDPSLLQETLNCFVS